MPILKRTLEVVGRGGGLPTWEEASFENYQRGGDSNPDHPACRCACRSSRNQVLTVFVRTSSQVNRSAPAVKAGVPLF